MSLEQCPRVLVGATLIDGLNSPPVKNSILIINDEYIIAVGKKDDIEVPEGSEIYDISDMTLLPGFIDSHCHFLGMGVSMLTTININKTRSLKDALKQIKNRVKQTTPGDWIIGKGYDESKWPENRYITKEDLDEFSPNNPIMLSRICGHLVSLNSKAMEIAGITDDTQDTRGGHVQKNEQGENTGILQDCRHLVQHAIPPISEKTLIEGLEKASNFALSLGCTGVHDAGLGSKEIKAYQIALKQGYLKVRTYCMIQKNTQNSVYDLGVISGFGNQMLRIGSMKLLMDGSIGAHTAALFEPYDDEPTTKGLLLEKPEVLEQLIKNAHQTRNQVAVHAIGDLAIEHVINGIQGALKEKPMKDHRHRIEHCELLTTNQIERISQLGIIPGMQPNFIGEWSGKGSMYEKRLGARRDNMSNPYRALLDENIKVAFGSDGMPFDPIYGIWSAVNHPINHNRITLTEAVMCYTYNSAYAGFQEDFTGSIEVGKLADLTVFDRDLTEIPSDELKDAKCYMTIVNGKIMYHSEN